MNGDTVTTVDDTVTDTTSEAKKTAVKRLNVADIEWLESEAIDDENIAATLSRLLEELISIRSKPTTAAVTVSSGQSSFVDFDGTALKDTMALVTDACDDELTCVKTAVHMIDKRADLMDKQLDRDHSESQKRLDRDADEKKHNDLLEIKKMELELKEKRLKHEKELLLIKKGMVPEDLIEGMVFMGEATPKKTAHQILAEQKKHAYHSSNADGDDEWGADEFEDGE